MALHRYYVSKSFPSGEVLPSPSLCLLSREDDSIGAFYASKFLPVSALRIAQHDTPVKAIALLFRHTLGVIEKLRC